MRVSKDPEITCEMGKLLALMENCIDRVEERREKKAGKELPSSVPTIVISTSDADWDTFQEVFDEE